ncbi:MULTISPECIES: ATP-binding protein [Rhodomicrobium]|uniref:ATP-binding protein n=1 Tax=Rhodomicrobium TaxID=1068 RepID=UPI000B4B865A|nr:MULTISPECIES: ATP-binding protein [Rhodomicrobium]
MQLKVLMIEDCEDDAVLLARYLKHCGFDPNWQRVDRAEDLAETVESRRWDLVLCDLNMPALTAFEAADCVRNINPDIPIIVVTGGLDPDLAMRLVQHGVQDIVLKDDLPRLKVAVGRELALARNRREKTAAEHRLAAAIETLDQGVALFDPDIRLIICNERYRASLDRCRADIVAGIAYADLLRTAFDRGQFAAPGVAAETTLKRLMAYQLLNGEPFEQQQHDGKWVKMQRYRTPDDGMVTVTTDITADKLREAALVAQAEQLSRINADLVEEIQRRETIEHALRESENRARAIFESAVDGVVTFSAEGLIETVNPAAAAMFGYAPEELTGTHIHHLVLIGTPDGGEAGQTGARLVTGWRKSGEVFPVELTISPVALRHRTIQTGIIRDVTERTRLDRLKHEFVAMVGHELRTPLTSIRGSLALLDHGVAGALPPRAQSMVRIGLENSERLLRLIGDILDIEKFESGKMSFIFEPTAVEALVDRAVEANRSFADPFNVRLRVEHLTAGGALIRADADRLTQVLANLISNAAKFSPDGGVVTIGTEAAGGNVRVWVEDQGPGVPEGFRDRIFQKFSQADSSDTRQKGGTGLGLSIAKAIVEQHGGSIGFGPAAAGHGTRFFFDLPLYRRRISPGQPQTGPQTEQIRLTNSNAS